MEEYQIEVYNINTFETIDKFIAEFSSIYELRDYMNEEIHNYKEPYYNLSYIFTTEEHKNEEYMDGFETAKELFKEISEKDKTTHSNNQDTIQPIDLINSQDLNFNLGNVVKYVCFASKKKGENILTDLEKAKDYINFEIERVKK